MYINRFIFLWSVLAVANAVFFCKNAYAQELSDIPLFVSEFVQDSSLKIGKKYYTSFETHEEFSKFYIVPQNHMGSASHDLMDEQKISGDKSHKSWVYGENDIIEGENTNHRAYPTFQFKKTSLGIIKSAVIVDFWAFVDVPLNDSEGENWVSLGTLTSYSDNKWSRAYLINLDYRYRLHLMHIPNQTQSYSDIYQAEGLFFPRGQWARVTAYIDYTTANRFKGPFIAVWQDGTLAGAAHFNDRIEPSTVPASRWPPCLSLWDLQSISKAEQLCQISYEGGLAQAHFGMYTPPQVSTGTVFNDDLTLLEILKN